MWNPDSYFEQLYHDNEPLYSFKAQSAEEWSVWQQQLRSRLTELLGVFPDRSSALEPELLERKEYPEYTRERVAFTTYDNLRMPAYVLIPKTNQNQVAYRAVIACHGHGYGSKDIVGLNPDGSDKTSSPVRNESFALELVKRGFLVIAPELIGFGDRKLTEDEARGPRSHSCDKLAKSLLLLGKTLAGFRVYETIRTLDYLCSRNDVDKDRIGCIGISGGGLVGAFTSALDERIKVSVVTCYANTFKDSILSVQHCLDNYVPSILHLAEMPHIIGLIAPRPLFIESGIDDPLFPVQGTQRAVSELTKIYSLLDEEHQLGSDIFQGGHEMRGVDSFDWLNKL